MVTQSDRAQRSIELFGLAALLVHRTSRDASAVLDRDGLNPAKFQLPGRCGVDPARLNENWEICSG